jgi:hypothetical protein
MKFESKYDYNDLVEFFEVEWNKCNKKILGKRKGWVRAVFFAQGGVEQYHIQTENDESLRCEMYMYVNVEDIIGITQFDEEKVIKISKELFRNKDFKKIMNT